MIYSHSSQPSILVNDYLPNTEIPGQNINNDFHLDSQSQDTKITLHSSADIPDKQTKKRRSKSKSVRISDPSTNSDSQLEKSVTNIKLGNDFDSPLTIHAFFFKVELVDSKLKSVGACHSSSNDSLPPSLLSTS
ncbi:11596_t:CDS:2 [Entrophospora sp. SA101]|nr:11596_t:CDS:2 [Entrophospora sp. SA101]